MRLSKSLLLGLRVFISVARLQSVTKAAAELNVTAGAVSQQLRQLEHLIGTDLFHRTGGRLVLTEEGHTLSVQTEASFHQLLRAVDDLARRASSNSLRVKLQPTMAIYWLLPRLTSFYALHPQIQLDISTFLNAGDCMLDQADLVVRIGTGQWEDGVADLIYPDENVLVCTPEIARRLHTPADVAAEHLLHSTIRPEVWPIWLKAHGLDPELGARGTRFAMAALVYQAAQKGLGVAVSQTTYLKGSLAAAGLVTPFPEPVKTGLGYYLVYEKSRAEQKPLRAFRDWIASVRS
ncbi:transcriptional regulator GcvA [Pigmentiphaga soli]|uniref:Transcriptional regulator GcvA n=1 Tax=Pigmentiphaga soli TaxID=1007095 RepID=A0ABP8GSM5_9BURK